MKKMLGYMVIPLVLGAWELPAWMGPNDMNWMPLTAEEIADAHTCSMGSMIVICAGAKRIAAGIIISSAKVGVSLPSDAPVTDGKGFSIDAFVEVKQSVPAWSKKFYVLSDENLHRMLEKARADPNWKPD